MARARRPPLNVDWTNTPLDPNLDVHAPDIVTARSNVRSEAADRGGHCACCGQDVKLYRRPITSAMAAALAQLYKHYLWLGWRQWPSAHDWVHLPTLLAQAQVPAAMHKAWHGGDPPKLRFWGLIERQVGERDDGSDRVGMYRLTELGRAFIERKVTISQYGFFYAQIFMGLDGPLIDIDEAFGQPFNLQNI